MSDLDKYPTSRRQMIFRYIEDSRAEMQLEKIPPAWAERTIEAWVSRLRRIPTEWLDRCYDVAMENHTRRGALIPQELLAAFGQIGDEVARARGPVASEEKTCPDWCSEDGWIILTFDGQRPSTNYDGYTYVKPCPIHRPSGIVKDSRQAPWCEGNWPRKERHATLDDLIDEKPVSAGVADAQGFRSVSTVAARVAQLKGQAGSLASETVSEEESIWQ